MTDSSDAAMAKPLCWITNAFDRSPAELLWVTSDRWGPLKGSLLNFSYGYGKIYVVPYEKVGGAGAGRHVRNCRSPQFPTGVMRGRFHPADGQLYCCGMFAWAGNQTQPGGFYRVRYTGKAVHLPIGSQRNKDRHENHLQRRRSIRRRQAIRRTTPCKPGPSSVRPSYGSKHYDEKPAQVTGPGLSADGKTVTLDIAEHEADLVHGDPLCRVSIRWCCRAGRRP